jgi:biotin transporter BioY
VTNPAPHSAAPVEFWRTLALLSVLILCCGLPLLLAVVSLAVLVAILPVVLPYLAVPVIVAAFVLYLARRRGWGPFRPR